MRIEVEIMINMFGQSLIDAKQIIEWFKQNDILQKRSFLFDLLYLIVQSKPKEEDIESVIKESNLKSTFTPCILLKKGVSEQNLRKIIDLPDNELNKVFVLLMTLFKISYTRRFLVEKHHPNKWWYWDLSNQMTINKILQEYKND